MDHLSSIQLIDNTTPAERPQVDSAFSRTTSTASSADLSRNISRPWSRPSFRRERTRRKYAKWQPDRLGIAGDSATEQPLSEEQRLSLAETNTNNTNTTLEEHDHRLDSSSPDRIAEHPDPDHFPVGGTTHQSKGHPKICGLKPGSELDILYENQRGWFFFGIPLYSHSSLLNLDPSPWMTADWRNSIVNITNAQLPDPSWEWAWRTWYVDMSGDVDEQGWQYAFSFGSSSWHGTHPFCHSFVRRRRWVRLRVKRASERARRGRTGLEKAHMLNEDYFTIHSALDKKKKKRASSSERASLSLSRVATGVDDEAVLEEIRNIPTLMYALKAAIVDREKLDAVKKFVHDGGDELYYLDGKVPEVMSRFVYQASRWQLLTYLKDALEGLKPSITSEREAEGVRRRREYLSKAVETARHHLTGPEVFHEPSQIGGPEPTTEMLDLTPSRKRDSLLTRYSGKFSFNPMDNGGAIKGIPKEAEIGREVHIY